MPNQFDERRVFGLQLRDAEVDKRTMTGLAAPYNEEVPIGGQYLETLAPGCFKRSVFGNKGQNLPLLTFHDSQQYPVGKAIRWDDTEQGLVGTWEFSNEEEADKAYRLARDGFIQGLSIGFQPLDSDVIPGSDTEPIRVIRKEARLHEVSLVSSPAYPSAQIMMVRTAGPQIARPHADRWRQWAAANLGA